MAERVRVRTVAERLETLNRQFRSNKRNQKLHTHQQALYWVNQWRLLASKAIELLKDIDDGPQYGD